MELKKINIEKPDLEKLELLKKCKECIYNFYCYRVPNGKCFTEKN